MLRNLHIKNIALIREIDIDFGPALNILTGETGAGKSIIIDAIDVGLGGKVSRSLFREGEVGLVELVFEVTDEQALLALAALDVVPEDGQLVFSRRLSDGKSYARINGETKTAQEMRRIAEILIDIHGQSEQQKLLREEIQLRLLDRFGGAPLAEAKETVRSLYERYTAALRALDAKTLDAEERARRISFLEFEINEIRAAALKDGEDAELEAEEKRLSNAQRITEAVAAAHALCGEDGAGAQIGRALQLVTGVADYDANLAALTEEMAQAEDLLNELNRALSAYLDTVELDEGQLAGIAERLDLINRLKMKYGQRLDLIEAACVEKEEELAGLLDYEETQKNKAAALKKAETELKKASQALHLLRKKAADDFSAAVMEQLKELHFARADFSVRFEETPYRADGTDAVAYYIATNPGESEMPLAKIASGGELSRIMLAIETIFAGRDAAETLIFDEVDAGISGRTAQKVGERLVRLAASMQVLCITHLPQIAAMADRHFGITKELSDEKAVTNIALLSEEETVEELARLLGGATITENTLASARELRALAKGKGGQV